MPRYVSLPICGILVGILSFSSAFAQQSKYEILHEQITKNKSIDTKLVRTLPEPETAEEYWIRSYTRNELKLALSDLRKAVELTADSPSRYLRTWLNLVLLEDPTSERFSYLRGVLGKQNRDLKPQVWLKAGKYAGASGHLELASKWAKQALEDKSLRSEARLDLAEYALRTNRYQDARRYLDRYLLSRDGVTEARYWILRGRYFRKTGADSEAYVAYSHLVRNYPNSLVLNRAEANLEKIPLPEAFRPGSTNSSESRIMPVNEANESDPERDKRLLPSGSWVLQLGSFRNRERALRYKRKLNSRLDDTLTVRSVRLDGVRYHRVQIVGFRTKSRARKRRNQLERNGIDSFIMEGSQQ